MLKNLLKRRYSFLILSTLLIVSCSKTVPRAPIKKKSASTLDLSMALNRKVYDQEEALIEKLIAKDSLDFLRSGNGFYYRFVSQDSLVGTKPDFGDRVTFEYNVINLANDTLYRTADISPVTNSLEQEYGVFKGMREALKLMEPGDVMEAYFPSYTAFGSYGDHDAIGPNTPFKSQIKLLSINAND
jgi:gliding motility-associated peptidyl-prolyl isomerase